MKAVKIKEAQFALAWVVFIGINTLATFVATHILSSCRSLLSNPDTRVTHGVIHLLVSLLGMAVSYFSYKLTVSKFVIPSVATSDDSISSKPVA
jgi:TRAP-type C4-dicarboxylate transport system permease small subunit